MSKTVKFPMYLELTDGAFTTTESILRSPDLQDQVKDRRRFDRLLNRLIANGLVDEIEPREFALKGVRGEDTIGKRLAKKFGLNFD
jgi:hypothetical protein